MKFHNPFKRLSRFELLLWCCSLAVVIISFAAAPQSILSLFASLIGATALIFVAKGHVLGQILTVVFAVFYGIISFELRYFGEMITYLGMTAPMAVLAIISWLKNPFQEGEVKISRMTAKKSMVLISITALVTLAFYFLLKALGNASLVFSTLSVTTSFLASALTFLRSPFYALAYAANDIVLIILWVIATAGDISYLPMVICFMLFLVNDIYGFINWKRMLYNQEKSELS